MSGRKSSITPESFNVKKFKVALDKKTAEKYKTGEKKNSPILYANAYYEYNNDETSGLVVQTGDIKITSYGVTKITEKTKSWLKTDEQRMYIRLPIDSNQPECIKLEKMCKALDDHMLNNKKTILSGLDGKFKTKQGESLDRLENTTYTTLIKYASSSDEEVSSDKPRMNAIKVKLNTHKKSKESETKIIDTKFYRKSEDGKSREIVPVTTMADVEKLITLGCTIRCVIEISTLWANKQPGLDGKTFAYGLQAKYIGIIVKKSGLSGSASNDYIESALFEDEGALITNGNNVQSIQPKPSIEEKKPTKSKDETEDTDESDDDHKPVAKPEPANLDTEENSESEEETDNKKTKPEKKVVKSKSSDDEDDTKKSDDENNDDEDDVPPRKSSKPHVDESKKKKKSDDDDNDSDIEKKQEKVSSKKQQKKNHNESEDEDD